MRQLIKCGHNKHHDFLKELNKKKKHRTEEDEEDHWEAVNKS